MLRHPWGLSMVNLFVCVDWLEWTENEHESVEICIKSCCHRGSAESSTTKVAFSRHPCHLRCNCRLCSMPMPHLVWCALGCGWKLHVWVLRENPHRNSASDVTCRVKSRPHHKGCMTRTLWECSFSLDHNTTDLSITSTTLANRLFLKHISPNLSKNLPSNSFNGTPPLSKETYARDCNSPVLIWFGSKTWTDTSRNKSQDPLFPVIDSTLLT